MTSILDKIKSYKIEEIAASKRSRSLRELEELAVATERPRGFAERLEAVSRTGFAMIGEIKRASPSQGVIREEFDPGELAMAYQDGGSACLSVLTDKPSFMGSSEHLVEARMACALPVLRKDFMYDTYQVVEARTWGADCILIIMASVSDAQAQELSAAAGEHGMDVLFEIHNELELDRTLKLGARLVGVNNRDLRTFDVSIESTLKLAPRIPNDRIVVSESGLKSHGDLARLARHGVRCFLVGESLMRRSDVSAAVQELLTGNDASGDPENSE
ncbi:MAG: indole-3-glycerol phosphate synthase TrpC [Rhodobacteraceae bacterium]|nr:indole-3-glycerol phosphate synthase TrpC [Paracoccaceae bacterium]MCY4140942.1 indole-3-glycerol phosphate synthase TrpC [Paracoccaceae bacterium]